MGFAASTTVVTLLRRVSPLSLRPLHVLRVLSGHRILRSTTWMSFTARIRIMMSIGPSAGLPTGGSPIPCYRKLVELHKRGEVSFANVVTFK